MQWCSSSSLLFRESASPSIILGNVLGMNDTLSGLVDLRTRRDDASTGGSAGVSFADCSATGLKDLCMGSEVGLEEDMLWGREEVCESHDERLLDVRLLEGSMMGLEEPMSEFEVGLDDDKLGGRDEDLLFDDSVLELSSAGSTGFDIGSNNGLRRDAVLDLLKAGFSSFTTLSPRGSDLLTSGSLCSSFPVLSEAKYSAPRPNTT